MKKNAIIFLALIMIIFTGCSTKVQHNYVPNTVLLNEPVINQVNTAYVGDVLLLQGKASKHDAIFLKTNLTFALFDTHTATKGYFLKVGENASKEFYLPSRKSNSGQLVTTGNAFNGLMAIKNEQTLCALTGDVEFCKKDAPFTRTQVDIATMDSFQQTLIYSGKVNNKINIGYREFSGNMARPAYNNEVEYDIATSNLIGYKGAKLEIIEATNEYIKYKVLRNFK